MEKTKDEQFEKLRNLWVSGDLEEVEHFSEKFNIFKALRLDNAEIRHSNFLAWLMNPRESHQLGDYFLKEFFKKAIENFILDERINVKPQDILNNRFYECEIRREDNNIDLLIINPDNKFVCLIENKIWSGEHSQQLERYAKYVEKEFKSYKKLHIFLTPEKSPSESVLQRGNAFYIQMSYGQVVAAIEKTLRHRSNLMPDDVRVFIEHYKKMVERNVMNKIDKEVMSFCRGIYRNHKEAIDLINKCTDSICAEVIVIIKKIIDEQNSITNANGNTIYFLPNGFDLKYGKEKNWLEGSVVGLYFGMNDNNTGFDFGISIQTADTANNLKRDNLITALENQFGEFRGKSDSWRWKPLLEVITFDEFCDIDSAKAKELIKDAIKTSIDKFNDAIGEKSSQNCLKA